MKFVLNSLTYHNCPVTQRQTVLAQRQAVQYAKGFIDVDLINTVFFLGDERD